MRRTFDAAAINVIANDADVRAHLGGEGVLDLGPTLADRANVALLVDHGAFIFARLEPGRYELHTMLLPEGRGAGVLPAAAEAFRYMFVRTDCVEIATLAPSSNPAAGLMARRAGFDPIFSRKAAWSDGSDLTFFALSLDRWRARDDEASDEGRAFHAALELAKAAAGSEQPVHDDDDAHDRAAGLACLMAKAGQVGKAVWSYNRWARLARYKTIELISDAPPIIDVRDALITFANGEMEVLQCL